MGYEILNVRTNVNAWDCTRGCADTVRESALKVDSGRKISCRTGESNPRRWYAGPMCNHWATSRQLSSLSSQLTGHAFFFSLQGCYRQLVSRRAVAFKSTIFFWGSQKRFSSPPPPHRSLLMVFLFRMAMWRIFVSRSLVFWSQRQATGHANCKINPAVGSCGRRN